MSVKLRTPASHRQVQLRGGVGWLQHADQMQPFHTDASDILGLYSLGEAEIGGECQLASTATIYNEIVKTRPDIINLLSSSSWVFDR